VAEGFVKLHRDILDMQWAKKPNILAVYIHLLLRATHEPVKVGEVELQVGQAVISLNGIADSTGLSMQQVRNALEVLEATKRITKTATKKYTLVTIENWTFEQSAKKKATKTATKSSTTNKKDNISKDILSKGFDKIIESWNKIGLTQVKKIAPGSERYKMTTARIDEYGLDTVLEVIDMVGASAFLTGKKTSWKASYDWFIAPRNFLKVYEGNYTDIVPVQQVPDDRPKIKF
jgi:DNA-binding transcriptional regulator YhcF (GntR family)